MVTHDLSVLVQGKKMRAVVFANRNVVYVVVIAITVIYLLVH